MSEPSFRVGQIVHHKLYDYRGVVAECDARCEADDAWYELQTQGKAGPTKAQPWYHVLVDGATHTTYVAEQNLEPDATGAPVRHPLLAEVFRTWWGGRYHKDSLN